MPEGPSSPPRPLPGQAVVRRHLDDRHDAVLGRGDFAAMFQAYLAHCRLWGIEPDGLGQVMMRQALGAACLYLSTRPRDETVAWTLNIARPPMNLFVTGSAADGTVTGRVFTEGVETTGTSRLFVVTQRAGEEAHESVVDVASYDVLQIFEHYARQSEQTRARYFELAETDFLMVASLPAAHPEWLETLTRAEALACIGHSRFLEERVFWFQCGCDPARMIRTVRKLYAGRLEELFQGEERVEVHCPRCGRRWQVTRAQVTREE